MYVLSYGYYAADTGEHRKCRANMIPPHIKTALQDMATQGLPAESDEIRYSYADHWTVTVRR